MTAFVVFVILFFVIFVIFGNKGTSRGFVCGGKVNGGDYCDTEVFRGECSEGEVIILDRALYGRMRLGRCVEISLGYLGCSADVITMADRRCSGKRVCEIRIPDAEFESTGPCLKELKTYLEASYTCVPVSIVTPEYCTVHHELNVTSETSGYIASVMTSDTPSCSGRRHPWLISGLPGQRVNMSLYDFTLDLSTYRIRGNHTGNTGQITVAVEFCREYGTIYDSGRSAITPICGGAGQRVTHLMLSLGNTVKIWVTAGTEPRDLSRFVIHYAVIGCADPELPENSQFIRTSNGDGIVTCLYSDVTWYITCQSNNTWSGVVNNCSSYVVTEEAMDVDVFTNSTQFHRVSGSMRTIGTAVLIAASSLLFVLVLVLVLRQRRNRRRHHRYHNNADNNVKTFQFKDDVMTTSHAVTSRTAAHVLLAPPPPQRCHMLVDDPGEGSDCDEIWQKNYGRGTTQKISGDVR